MPQILIHPDCVNLFRIRCNGQTETTFSNKNSGIRFSEDDGDERRKLLLFVLLLYSWVFPFIHILLTDRVVEWGTCTKRKKFFSARYERTLLAVVSLSLLHRRELPTMFRVWALKQANIYFFLSHDYDEEIAYYTNFYRKGIIPYFLIKEDQKTWKIFRIKKTARWAHFVELVFFNIFWRYST